MKGPMNAKLGLCFAITLSLSHTVVVAQSIEQQLQELRAESLRLMKRIEDLERLAAQQAAKKQTIPQAHVTPLASGKGILELRTSNTTLS
ncbi:secreted protein, partial [Candidatus Thiomargarita nelsonii]